MFKITIEKKRYITKLRWERKYGKKVIEQKVKLHRSDIMVTRLTLKQISPSVRKYGKIRLMLKQTAPLGAVLW